MSGEAATPFGGLTLAEARTLWSGMGAATSLDDVDRRHADGPVPVRIYRPPDRPRATVLYIPGGGWVLGDLASHDGLCTLLALATPAVVVAMDHRKAPEHPFPAALDDVNETLAWVRELAAAGSVPSRVTLAGDSSGAWLAAAASRLCADVDPPKALALIYPVIDAHRPSAGTAWGEGLTAATLSWFSRQFLPDPMTSAPALDPWSGDDLRRLPPTLVLTAQHDVCRAEAEDWWAVAASVGAPVTYCAYIGQQHGFVRRLTETEPGRHAIGQVAAHLRSAAA